MNRIGRARLTALLCLLLPATLSSQALPSLASLRVGYNTRKATVHPDGALKLRIDSVDAAIADATRQGRTGEIRRLIAKGNTLLGGREWTDALDYSGSLVLRSDRVVVDPAKPYVVRLEQIYAPSIQLQPDLVAKVVMRRRQGPIVPAADGRAMQLAVVREWGTFDGVSRDLRESPQNFELDLTGIPTGDYQLVVEVSAATQLLGSVNLPIHVHEGLDALVARLEDAAKRGPESVRADMLYPVDRMRQVNRGRLELRTFDPAHDFAAAESVVVATAAGKDPFAARTGDFKRHYLLASADEMMPYHVYVPTGYTPTRAYPLIVALHGLGATEDSFFASYETNFPRLAQERGYILVAPLGYRVDGGYGWGVGNPPADPAAKRTGERSEDDVMQVLALMRKQYRIDGSRIYLMGHSMGAIGTWKIAPKYPEVWAAIGMFAGSGVPATLERIRSVPNFVVHGDADATVNVEGSRRMVAKMKELGMEVQYIEVPGGTHGGVVAPNAAAMFDFFDAHRKKGATSSR
jgi:poly(3-hydroxybutyrate) depolymerase